MKSLPDIWAVVLCAGEGTRIKEYSKNLPKPLIKVGNVSILEILLNCLYKLGIERVALVKGYLGNEIDGFAKYYREKKRIEQENLIVIDAKEDYKLGPLHSLLSITSIPMFFKKNIHYLIFPGDVIYDPSLLQNIFNKIANQSDDRSAIFYREINIDTLNKKKISIAIVGEAYSARLLRQIIQINLEEYSGEKIVNLIIPLFFSNYDYLQMISQFDQVKSIDTLRQAINISALQGYNINPVKIQSEKNFYDIDNQSDLEEYKKKK